MAETAIVVPVPEAEALVGHWRRRYTPSGAAGMPAHITLLIPFIDSHIVNADRARKLGEVLGRFEPIELSLVATAYFEGPPAVLYLEPKPAGPFVGMTEALVHAFPECQPYDGVYDRIVPHLTVATRLDRERLGAIAAEVAGTLPVTARPGEAWLMAFAHGAWRLWNRLPLAAA